MTVANLTAAREFIETVIDAPFVNVPVGRIAWPDTDFTPPAPANDLASPERYVVLDVAFERAAESDFAGGVRIDGKVLFDIWVEKRAGDRLVLEIAEELRTRFSTADVPGFQFLEPLMTQLLVRADGTWCGRGYGIPFVWFRTA